jgi:hypothetical protein
VFGEVAGSGSFFETKEPKKLLKIWSVRFGLAAANGNAAVE